MRFVGGAQNTEGRALLLQALVSVTDDFLPACDNKIMLQMASQSFVGETGKTKCSSC